MKNNNDSRAYTAEELETICPILKIMHSLSLIGLTSVRSVYIDWGQQGYIISVYERLRSTKDHVVDIGANI